MDCGREAGGGAGSAAPAASGTLAGVAEPAEPKPEEARGFDLGQIITRAALRPAAGLMK